MLQDLFWPNLAVFGLGQAAAWFQVRTGRVLRGTVSMVALLVLADLVLVARFAYGEEALAGIALTAMQAWAVGETVLLVFARWRRARPAALERRRRDYRLAIVSELRGADAEALPLLAKLARQDPWDIEVAIALAATQRRLGNGPAARRQLRRARRLDRSARFADVLFLEDLRLRRPAPVTAPAAQPAARARKARAGVA